LYELKVMELCLVLNQTYIKPTFRIGIIKYNHNMISKTIQSIKSEKSKIIIKQKAPSNLNGDF